MRQHRQQRLHEITTVFIGLSPAVVLTTTDDLPRCPECGTVDSGEHPYCPECGQEL